MAKRFSDNYATYEDWHRNAQDTPYKHQIARLHYMHPGATLDQLRRHPKNGERL